MSIDELQHMALPKLYGAPAYARPAVAVAHTPRPVDVDDLPLAMNMTDEDREIVQSIPDWGGRVPSVIPAAVAVAEPQPVAAAARARSFRVFAGRLLRPGA